MSILTLRQIEKTAKPNIPENILTSRDFVLIFLSKHPMSWYSVYDIEKFIDREHSTIMGSLWELEKMKMVDVRIQKNKLKRKVKYYRVKK
jgi:DNA-binding PadR family transcriptional regulator